MFPCRGRQNDAKGTKIKTCCTLEAAVLLPPFCSAPPLQALIFTYAHIMHVISSVLHIRQHSFLAEENQEFGWEMHFCKSTHKSEDIWDGDWRLTCLRLPNTPKSSNCRSLIESEEWRNSFVVLKNSNISQHCGSWIILMLISGHLTSVYCSVAALLDT